MARRVSVAQQREWLRESLMAAVTPEDMQEVVMMLIDRARNGSISAAKELLDRVLGKPTQELIMETRVERTPNEIRQQLAALLLQYPELNGTLATADTLRRSEAAGEPLSEEALMREGVVDAEDLVPPEEYEEDL